MAKKAENFIGYTFNQITITALSEANSKGYYWEGVCSCGNKVRLQTSTIKRGKQWGCRSCGVKHVSVAPYAGREDIRQIWISMVRRCHLKRDSGYRYYGARGIRVCKRWREDFEAFAADMGPKPPGYSIERIDNCGPYAPDNCKWIPRYLQSRNRRYCQKVRIGGVTKILSDWLREYNLTFAAYHYRLKHGMTQVEAITTPKKRARIATKLSSGVKMSVLY